MFRIIATFLLFIIGYALMLYGAFSIHSGFGFFVIGAFILYEIEGIGK